MRLLSIQAVSEQRSDWQGELFEVEPPTLSSRKHKRESGRKQLESEMRYLGTTLEAHPLELWPSLLTSKTRVFGKDIPTLVGQRVELVGWPITAKPVLTSEDEPMEFISSRMRPRSTRQCCSPRSSGSIGTCCSNSGH